MSLSPIAHAVKFWQLSIDEQELRELSHYGEPDGRPSQGITVLHASGPARRYRVREGDRSFSLYAAVRGMDKIPQGSEVLAEIWREDSVEPHSYVLWYPDLMSAVVPFEPNAAIEAFWLEDYMAASRRTVLPRPILAFYYAVKPMVPSAVRRGLRRGMAQRVTAHDGFLDWPGDDSLDSLQRLLLRVIMLAAGREEVPFAWFWPDGRAWSVVLTHDVETADGVARVPHVVDLEERRGLRSSFNFVVSDYEVSDALMRRLASGGFEVGVHGYTHDGLMFTDRSTFLERVGPVNECARRWGAVGFRSPATYRNHEWFHQLDFEYDSSYSDTAPFEPQPGGCASFFPYQLDGLLEMPITLPQDHTLFGLLRQTDAATWLAKLERIRDAHGMACVLTHPDPAEGYIGLDDNEARYLEVLDAVVSSDAWVPLPRELVRWWTARLTGAPSEMGSRLAGTAVLDASGRVSLVPPE